MASTPHPLVSEMDELVAAIQAGQTAEQVRQDHKQLCDKHPELVEMAIRDQQYDRGMLIFMLEQQRALQQGTLTADKADVIIGQVVFDRYCYNLKANLPSSSHSPSHSSSHSSSHT